MHHFPVLPASSSERLEGIANAIDLHLLENKYLNVLSIDTDKKNSVGSIYLDCGSISPRQDLRRTIPILSLL